MSREANARDHHSFEREDDVIFSGNFCIQCYSKMIQTGKQWMLTCRNNISQDDAIRRV